MHIEHWESFQQKAEELFRARPLHTRYVLKYRNRDAKLLLKVTDDVQCFRFATDQQADLKKVEALNNHFFQLMSISTASAEPMDTDEPAVSLEQTPIETTGNNVPSSQQQNRKPKRRG